MKLFNRITYNKLLKLGYKGEQIVAILGSVNPSTLLDLIDTNYSADDIRETGKFISRFSNLNDIKSLDYEKKMMIIKSYNYTSEAVTGNSAIWGFVIDIAKHYDKNILSVTLEKLLNDKPDMEFIGLVKTAIDQNIDLHDLSCFKTSIINKKQKNL